MINEYKVSVEIDSHVNEIFSTTKVTQRFKNPESNPLELKIYIYKKKDILFSSFSAKIGDSIKVKSKVIKKQKAEEKYGDAIASGNAAIYVTEDSYNNRIILNMGNIPPKEEIILICDFIKLTESSKKYEFEFFRDLPIFKGANNIFQNLDLIGNIEIKTQNEIINIEKEILLNNLKIYEEKNNKEENIYLIKYKIKELPEFDSSSNYFNRNSNKIFEYIPCSKIYFDIKNENGNNIIQPKIYYQKSNLNPKENSYIVNFKNNKKNDKLNPALFIFLIDQSGSMEYGKYGWNNNSNEEELIPIKIVSKALELFLQSLPKNSYYQLIGFGSTFIKYDENPKKYTKENIQKSLEIIKSLNANLGGTDIYSPLKSIYENEKEYDKIKLPTNIFLLTDGEINNKDLTLEIIEKYSSKFSIYSIGIGDSFDKDLIKNAGIIGKGGFNFCPNLEGINRIIINEINKAISPYITDFKINCSLDKKNKYKVCDIPHIIRNNEIINVGYITDNIYNKINIDIEYFDEKTIKNKYNIIPIKIKNGEELSKLIIYKFLSNNSNDKEIEDLSLKYQILTKNTALFTEIELSNKINDEMKKEILGNKKNNNINDSHGDNNYFHNIHIDKNNIINESFCCKKRSSRNVYLSQLKFKRMGQFNDKNIVGAGNYYLAKSKKKEFSFPFNLFNCCKNVEKIIKTDKNYEIETEKNTNINININKSEENFLLSKKENSSDNNDNIEYKNKDIINLKNKDDVLKILSTQDFIEGNWEYNEHTKYVKEKYLDKFNIIKEKLKLNDSIIITILIIFFIEKEYSELLNELNIIIRKGKLYIQNNAKKSYEEIINLI